MVANVPNKQSEFVRVKTEAVPTTLPGTTRTDLGLTEVMQYLNLYLSGEFDVAGGGADGVFTPEGTLSLISEIRLIGTSKTGRNVGIIKRFDFAAAYQLAGFLSGVLGYRETPAVITKGSTPEFAVDSQLDFQMQHSTDPRKTLLKCGEFSALTLECDWRPYTDVFSAGTITTGGAGISLRVSARQFTDLASKQGKYGIHIGSYQEKAVVAATSDFTFDVKRGYYLRGIMVKTFTRNAVIYHTPVDTVINSLTLKCDKKERKHFDSIGVLKAENQQTYKFTPATGYSFIDLMPDRRYDNLLNERAFGNVELTLDVNAVANSVVRIYPVEIML